MWLKLIGTHCKMLLSKLTIDKWNSMRCELLLPFDNHYHLGFCADSQPFEGWSECGHWDSNVHESIMCLAAFTFDITFPSTGANVHWLQMPWGIFELKTDGAHWFGIGVMIFCHVGLWTNFAKSALSALASYLVEFTLFLGTVGLLVLELLCKRKKERKKE